MKFVKDNVIAFCAGLFTVVMLVIGALYAYLHYSEDNGIAEMGAFLAGIFAPIAWAWFLASYAIQNSELKLQREALTKQTEELSLNRKELSLQRAALETQVEELKHSVQDQQGSEAALKEQSEALKKQLDITAKQFQYYLEEKEAKHPLFEVVDYQLFTKLEQRGYNPIPGKYLTTKELPDFFRVILANHKADCIVKSVKVLQTNPDLTIETYPKLELRDHGYIDTFREKINEKTEYITFKLTDPSIKEKSPAEYKQLIIKKLEWTIFIVNYSYADTSSNDVYEFYLDEKELKTRLLEGD